jgi:ABC-type nitrate/sulfonate/bicarbonate transport system permease component
MIVNRCTRPIIILLGLVAAWYSVVALTEVPRFILPGPGEVATALIIHSGVIFDNAAVTLAEIVAGFLIGAGVGTLSAVTMSIYRPARQPDNPGIRARTGPHALARLRDGIENRDGGAHHLFSGNRRIS